MFTKLFSIIKKSFTGLFFKKPPSTTFLLQDPVFNSDTKFYITVSTEKAPVFHTTNTFYSYIEETFWVVDAAKLLLSQNTDAKSEIAAALLPFVHGAPVDFTKLGQPFTTYQSVKEFKQKVQSLKDECGQPIYSNVSEVPFSEKIPVNELKSYA